MSENAVESVHAPIVEQAKAEDRGESSTLSRLRRKGVRGATDSSPDGSQHRFTPPDQMDSRRVYSRGRYRTSQISGLLVRYASIRADLITCASKMTSDQRNHAELCREHLLAAKAELESRRQKLSVCSNLLALADRELVNLYLPQVLPYRLSSVAGSLQALKPPAEAETEALRYALGIDQTEDPESADKIRRMALRDALTCIHGRDDRSLLEDDLQVTRLRRLIGYVFLAFVALLIAVPLVTTPQVDAGGAIIWPTTSFTGSARTDLLISTAGLAAVGAVGGVLSGMLTVRDSRAVLAEYRTSMLKLNLKPLAGAVAALVVYLFLAAEVVSGVEVTNPGVYVVVAFLAGFSERYFMRVLRAQEQREQEAGAAAGQ